MWRKVMEIDDSCMQQKPTFVCIYFIYIFFLGEVCIYS